MMASINGITLKNIDGFLGHEGEPLFQGDLYVGNTKVAFWSQDDWGGIMDNLIMAPGYSDDKLREQVIELNKEKARHGTRNDGSTYTVDYDLENQCRKLLVLMDSEEWFKEHPEHLLLVVSDGYHTDRRYLKGFLKDYSDDTILQIMEKAINEMKADFYPENNSVKHTVELFRDASDFTIGKKIKLKDIKKEKSLDEQIKTAKSSGGKIVKSSKSLDDLDLER